jgi:FixJ family two-component response regulator
MRAKRANAPRCSIVLNVRLPGASGLEFQRTRAIKSGAEEFLTKPLREQELLNAVQACIEQESGARRPALLQNCRNG